MIAIFYVLQLTESCVLLVSGNNTSILSKIERNERRATTEMIPILAETLDKAEKEIEIQYIQSAIITDLGELKFLKEGLKEILKTL